MAKLFKLPDFSTDEQKIVARLIDAFSAGLIVLSILFLMVIPLVAPGLLQNSLLLAGTVIPVSAMTMFLVRRNRLQFAGILLTTLLWFTVTMGAIRTGGVSAPITIGYMIVIIIGWSVLNQPVKIVFAAGCILTTILIALAGMNGLLPEAGEYSMAARASIYIFFFLVAVVLQAINTFNINELLYQAKKNEAQYQSLLENIPAVTYTNSTGVNAQTKYVSPQVEKLLGYPRNAFTDDPLLWTKILHPDDLPRVIRESDRTADTGEPFVSEYRVITKDSKIIWLRDEARLVHNEEGKPLHWLGIWTNITEQKQAEVEQTDLVNTMTKRTLQLQTAAEVARAATSILDINELLPNVVELIRDHFEYYYAGIFLIDENREWAVLSAATGDMGRQMLEVAHRLKVEDSSMIGWCMTHKQARIALDVGEDAVRFANPYLPLTRSEMALPLITHGEVIGAMTIQSEKPAVFSKVDITALQTLADQVATAIENARLFTEGVRLNKELEMQNEELERFSYTVSHDLRAPLVTIRGFLGYLRQDAQSGDMTRFDKDMNRIANAVDKMQTLLNELLELSRIGRIVNPPEDVPFGEIVRETADLLSGSLEAGNIRLNIMEEFPIVHIDRLRIGEVVQNLLSNAIKFMGDQPNPVVEIGCKGSDTDGKPIFYVRDNGIGIDPIFHDRIFGLFNRLDPGIEGTGIGLTLVKRIIDNHGGRIWINSEPGKGATFLFTLPVPDL